jgi:multiple sugar transport system ATP-binding protein
MTQVCFEGVTKAYTEDVEAVRDFSLEVQSGECLVLVGPSGCGKSTLLSMVAGLEEVSDGHIAFDGEDVTPWSARRRDVAVVFQNYALYPHMTVRKNLGFGLRMRRVPKDEIAEKVQEVARTLGLEALLERKTAALSGGQRQRVAIGRAIVRSPRLFLMDEPLSNLDAKLRDGMRGELLRLHRRLGTTTIYVTHDQVEAMTLGDRVAVMRNGVLQQCGTPKALYRNPANLFVALFLGTPAMNLAEGRIAGGQVEFAGFRVPAPAGVPANLERVIVGVRPTELTTAERAGEEAVARLRVTLDTVEDLGRELHVRFPVEGRRVALEQLIGADHGLGQDQRLFADDDRAMFNTVLPGHARVATGDPLELALDPAHVHLFDAETGTALAK